MLFDAMSHRHVSLQSEPRLMVDPMSVSRSLENFIFRLTGGYSGSQAMYRRIWLIFHAFVVASIREDVVPMHRSVNEFGVKLFDKIHGECSDHSTEKVQYARLVCLEIL